jgi:septum formation protein
MYRSQFTSPKPPRHKPRLHRLAHPPSAHPSICTMLLSLPIKHLVDTRAIRIVLASGSPRREEALTELLGGRQLFDVVVSRFEEKLPHADYATGAAYCLATAREKAKDVLEQLRDEYVDVGSKEKAPRLDGEEKAKETFVIAADTVVALGKEILEKPADARDAVRMLTKLSGVEHQVHTAVLLYELNTGAETFSFVTTSTVRFAKLDAEEIQAYVDSGEPMGRAGAYAIQGKGRVLVESMTGDFFNVAGFPSRDFATRFATRLKASLTR